MTPILSTVYFGDALKIPNLLQTGPLEPGPEAPDFALLGKGGDSTPRDACLFPPQLVLEAVLHPVLEPQLQSAGHPAQHTKGEV